MTRRKIVVIGRCQDCPVVLCEHKQLCGCIPEACVLPDADTAEIPSNTEAQRSGDAEGDEVIGTHQADGDVCQSQDGGVSDGYR